MTPFARALAASDGVIDRLRAETFFFTPMREVKNGQPVADAARDTLSGIVANFDDAGRNQALPGQGEADISSTGPMLWLTDAQIPQGIRRFDRFLREETGRTYEVRSTQPSGLGRLLAVLVEL